ncbi:WD40-repeat-containing domain protein [Chytriomyces sp. MP71]|nr:WD40-repeat-containing domain protein [Chytriomyces sp. MP71]
MHSVLGGGTDARIHVYDLEATRSLVKRKAPVVARADKNNGHKFSVTGVSWYPGDTGIFTSCSTDRTIRVWDTNSMQVACTFNMKEKVYIHCMSSIASNSALIAAGGESNYVRLCDLRTGDHAQMLSGHNGPVTGISWSRTEEYVLATGSRDDTIRIWDIRKSRSCLADLTKRDSPPSTAFSATKSTSTAFKKSASMPPPPPKHNAILGLAYTTSGSHLLSLKLDGTFDIWSAYDFAHVRTHAIDPSTHFGNDLNAIVPVMLQVGASVVHQDLVVVPSVGDSWRGIGVYEVHSGRRVSLLRGHFLRSACVAARQETQQLISGGFDGEVLCWSPQFMRESWIGDDDPSFEAALRDAWSDEEDGGS